MQTLKDDATSLMTTTWNKLVRRGGHDFPANLSLPKLATRLTRELLSHMFGLVSGADAPRLGEAQYLSDPALLDTQR